MPLVVKPALLVLPTGALDACLVRGPSTIIAAITALRELNIARATALVLLVMHLSDLLYLALPDLAGHVESPSYRIVTAAQLLQSTAPLALVFDQYIDDELGKMGEQAHTQGDLRGVL